jgi:hypothetical protein
VLRLAGVASFLLIGLVIWPFWYEGHAQPPAAVFEPHPDDTDMEVQPAQRDAVLRRAQLKLEPAPGRVDLASNPADPDGTLSASPVVCRFTSQAASGTTPKFDCVLAGGEVVKVKYGRNPEIHAELAASRLLTALGYPADRMYLVPHLRCFGCPRRPFTAIRLLGVIGLGERFPAFGAEGAYTDFDWVAVERKFEGRSVETSDIEGWAWWELKHIDPSMGASRVELDALRLLAVFLAHWDNKASNQRLVCTTDECSRPLAMMHDLGSTFGPVKANLAEWQTMPVWDDRATCRVSMRMLPFGGATFPDARISEAARLQLGHALAAFTDTQIRDLFRGARFPEYYSPTDDQRDLDAWTDAFRRRTRDIMNAGPCT